MNSGGGESSGDNQIDETIRIVTSEDLSSGANGTLLLFAIGLAVRAHNSTRGVPEDFPPQKHLSRTIWTLTASYIIRNAVIFAF